MCTVNVGESDKEVTLREQSPQVASHKQPTGSLTRKCNAINSLGCVFVLMLGAECSGTQVFCVFWSGGSEIKEKVTTENVHENSSASFTEEDNPTDTAQGSKDEDIVEQKGPRNSVLWRYFGY